MRTEGKMGQGMAVCGVYALFLRKSFTIWCYGIFKSYISRKLANQVLLADNHIIGII